jgi:hypothetical protein
MDVRSMAMRFSMAAETGVIIKGPRGAGKHLLAGEMSRLYTCTLKGLTDCKCASCQSFYNGQHPDITWVKKNEGARSVGIDIVREHLQLSDKPAVGKRRCVIVQDMGSMTEEAQNGILKISEDFPDRLTIIGLYESGPLLDTIKSRMAVFEMPPLSKECFMEYIQENRVEKGVEISSEELYLMTGGYPCREVDGERLKKILLAVQNRDEQGLLKSLNMWTEGDKNDYFLMQRDCIPELLEFLSRIFLKQLAEHTEDPVRICELITLCGNEEQAVRKPTYGKLEWAAFISKLAQNM